MSHTHHNKQNHTKNRHLPTIAECNAAIASSRVPLPLKAEAFLFRALCHREEGNPDEELADYNTLLSMSESPAELKAVAHNFRALYYLHERKHAEAIADYLAVLANSEAPPGISNHARIAVSVLKDEEDGAAAA